MLVQILILCKLGDIGQALKQRKEVSLTRERNEWFGTEVNVMIVQWCH